MKSSFSGALLILGSLALGTVVLHADTTATTVPVGYITQTFAAASSSSSPTCGTASIPLYTAAEYAGLITSVDSTTAFSCSTAAWTGSDFISSPHFARVKSGANAGRCFPITSFTATQLTVSPQGATDTQPYDLKTLLSAGDAFEVLPANTFGSLFGLTGGPFLTGTTAGVSDNVYLWNVATKTWDVFFNNGTHWRKTSSLKNQDSVILYPEEGMYIVHRDTTKSLTLTFLGTVPSTPERTDTPGPGSVCVALRFPVDATLTSLALQNLPNWQSGTTAGTADNVYIWNTTAKTWDVCFYNGTHWRKTSSIKNIEDTESVLAGRALFFVRQSTAAASNSTFVQNLPYSLN